MCSQLVLRSMFLRYVSSACRLPVSIGVAGSRSEGHAVQPFVMLQAAAGPVSSSPANTKPWTHTGVRRHRKYGEQHKRSNALLSGGQHVVQALYQLLLDWSAGQLRPLPHGYTYTLYQLLLNWSVGSSDHYPMVSPTPCINCC